jgi:hypothetical protein
LRVLLARPSLAGILGQKSFGSLAFFLKFERAHGPMHGPHCLRVVVQAVAWEHGACFRMDAVCKFAYDRERFLYLHFGFSSK